MTKPKVLSILATLGLFLFTLLSLDAQTSDPPFQIKRLTFSDNNSVLYPSLSDDGQKVAYVLEIKENGAAIKSIRILDVISGEEKELFRSGTKPAPPPFQDSNLFVGTKPPVINSDGRQVIFSLNVGEPVTIFDHYLAVVDTQDENLRLFPFPIRALEGKNLKSTDFETVEWERLSNYAISSAGDRVVCVVKGHLGPRRYGNASGLITLDLNTEEQRTLIAPDWVEGSWIWSSLPQNPLTGGGWSFGLSGDGRTILFGAQSSQDPLDYDLYTMDWTGEDLSKITSIQDRWFSLADISFDGTQVVFYYTGQKEQGIGTYVINTRIGEWVFLRSSDEKGIEFVDASTNGRYIVYKNIYNGILFDLETGKGQTVFDERTPGYAIGVSPMDFPRIPSFWCPQFMNMEGNRILLMGEPQGSPSPEIYMLSIK